ncbi:protein CHUP1, chloroplastic-like [Tasmannia lanceolata]|uniref:protein CHUP1, chloroplastic-like n=1 Tax=Tasmannia lanceolata TaxID=3420 RepID=UPI004063872D
MLKEGKGVRMKPVLLKIGVALALSFAGYLYSHLRTRRIRPHPPPPSGGNVDVVGKEDLKEIHEEIPPKDIDNTVIGFSPSSRSSGDEQGFLLPEFNELVQNQFMMTRDSPTKADVLSYVQKARKGGDVMAEMEQEIINLRNMVQVLLERERDMEIQLLEFYGLREQETAVQEMQNRLKINTMEAKLFTLKIESLQADNRRLEAQVSDYSKVVSELESARANIKQLKRKISLDSEQTKEHLSALQKMVIAWQNQECKATSDDSDVQKKLQRLKDFEKELTELKRVNSRLQCENSDLSMKLESTQILASSFLEGPEPEVFEEANHLRQASDELTKEIERLRMDRCSDAEELVYLRWVNACLRYELRNYQAPPGKAVARDLSKTLSPKSEEKAKQLILEYSNSGIDENSISLMDFDLEYSSSSQASTFTEMGEFDDSSVVISSATGNSSSKSKFLSKLKKLVLGKDSHNGNNAIDTVSYVGRTSTSCGTSGRRGSLSIGSLDETQRTYSYDSISSCATVEHSTANLHGSQASFSAMSPKRREAKIIDERQNKITLSKSMAKSSLDLQSLRNLHLENIREVEDHKARHSDVGSSYLYRGMVLREGSEMDLVGGGCQLDQVHDAEKLELLKFAHVLKSSLMNPKLH